MGDQLYLERFVWFDNEARKERYPNASKLAEQFELSVKSAQRTIDHFRDRLPVSRTIPFSTHATGSRSTGHKL